MLTKSFFVEIVKDLFSEYLPKVKASERKEFVSALLEELAANGVEFEDPVSDDEAITVEDEYE